jgi:hypothetical protein
MNNLKTMKPMEADREIEIRENEISSIGKNLPKIETDPNPNRLSELEETRPNHLEEA